MTRTTYQTKVFRQRVGTSEEELENSINKWLKSYSGDKYNKIVNPVAVMSTDTKGGICIVYTFELNETSVG